MVNGYDVTLLTLLVTTLLLQHSVVIDITSMITVIMMMETRTLWLLAERPARNP